MNTPLVSYSIWTNDRAKALAFALEVRPNFKETERPLCHKTGPYEFQVGDTSEEPSCPAVLNCLTLAKKHGMIVEKLHP